MLIAKYAMAAALMQNTHTVECHILGQLHVWQKMAGQILIAGKRVLAARHLTQLSTNMALDGTFVTRTLFL